MPTPDVDTRREDIVMEAAAKDMEEESIVMSEYFWKNGGIVCYECHEEDEFSMINSMIL